MRDTPAMLRELDVVEQRYQAVLEVLDGIPVTEVAERFGGLPPDGAPAGGPLPRERADRAGRPLPCAEGSSRAGQR
jgi:hypothetical protein